MSEKLTHFNRQKLPQTIPQTVSSKPPPSTTERKKTGIQMPKNSRARETVAVDGGEEKSFNLKFTTNVLGIWQQRQLLIGGWKKFFHCFRSSCHIPSKKSCSLLVCGEIFRKVLSYVSWFPSHFPFSFHLPRATRHRWQKKRKFRESERRKDLNFKLHTKNVTFLVSLSSSSSQ